MTTTPTAAEMLRDVPDRWADPPSHMIGKLPKGGAQLDYMGHADITLALIDVDPEWTWEPGWHSTAGPIDPFAMGPGVLLARLTVHGKTLPCVGTIEARKVDTESALKELVSDMLRNGAMRFGIATLLWAKSQRRGTDPDESHAPAARRQRQLEQPPWTVAMMKAKAVELAEGDTALASEAYELAVGMVDSDTTFPQERVAQLVHDMEQWLSSRLSGRFHGSEVHGGDDTPSAE